MSVFKIAVNEGPRNISWAQSSLKGFHLTMLPGSAKMGSEKREVYDQSYAVRFLRDDAGEILSRIAKRMAVAGKAIVNLMVELKD